MATTQLHQIIKMCFLVMINSIFMMKKLRKIYLHILQILVIGLISFCFGESCNLYKRPSTVSTSENNTDTIKNDDFFNVIQKNYKFTTGQGYQRIAERNYFGQQNKAPELFKKFDIKKGINIQDYQKYPLASFFADGVFNIPEDKKLRAYEIFSPIIDSILAHASNDSFFHAEIVVLGYSDESPMNKNSDTYQFILEQKKQALISENEYYNYLSYLRAKEIYDILIMAYAEKMDKLNIYATSLVDIVAEGKGIEYPDAKKNYKLNDEKRRITKIYWRVY